MKVLLFFTYFFLTCAIPVFAGSSSAINDSLNALFERRDYNGMLPLCKELTSKKEVSQQAKGYYWKGLALAEMDQSEAALKALYAALERFQKLNEDENVAKVYGEIAVVYYDAADLKRAESFMVRSIKMLQKNPEGVDNYIIAAKYFNLANLFLTSYSQDSNKSEKEKALLYYNKAEAISREMSGTENEHLLQMIAASRTMLYAISNDPEYILEFPKTLAYFISIRDSGQVSLLYSSQVYYAMHQENYEEALAYSDSALAHFPSTSQATFLEDYYSARSEVLEKLGRYEESLVYRKKADSLDLLLHDPESIGNMHAISKKAEKEEIKREHAQTVSNLGYWIMGSLILLLISAVVLIILLRRRKKLKKELALLAEENRRFEIELSRYSKGESMLSDHSSYAYLIDELVSSLSKNDQYEAQSKHIEKTGFPFVAQLKKQHPNLSKNDVRLCFFLLVGMRSKEIANILHIEPASVDRQRYRLRKKMGVKTGENLGMLLEKMVG